MKILLIQPPSGAKLSDSMYLHDPLELEYLGAGLAFPGERWNSADRGPTPAWTGCHFRTAP